MIERKHWRTLMGARGWFHLARIPFGPGRVSRLHTHDFPEICWVESGVALHEINGLTENLSPGDIVFIRAADRHRLRPADRAGFVLGNLAFPASLLADLMERHREVRELHAARPAQPMHRQLSEAQVEQLREDVRRLAPQEITRLAGERFLLGLYLMAVAAPAALTPALPEWLASACLALERQNHFREGLPAFFRLCGRSPEYVARTCRQLLDRSPTELVNRVRVEHAARELRLGGRPILEIALESGFNNLAHFYKVFQVAYHHPPRQYRLAQQRSMV